jgi:hypothetical protein
MSEKNPFFQIRNYPGQGGGTLMFKGILGIVAVSALLSIAPAVAAEMECTEANMTNASADMDKMAAGEKKSMGMKEMTMAKEMMDKKDMAGCKMHMNKAMEMGMSK